MAKKISARTSVKKTKKQSKKAIIISVLIILFCAVGALFMLTKQSKVETIEPVKEEVKPKVELPPPPEEKWSYIKALESRTVNDNGQQTQNKQNHSASEKLSKTTQKKETGLWAVLDNTQTDTVQKSKPQISSGKVFGLQCGAFDQQNQAETRQAKLAMLGFSAHIEKGGKWYRVFIGPIGTRSQAQQALNKTQGTVDCLVIAM